VLRALASQGHSIIFISHKLREVMDISDRIAVLRRGRIVGEIPTSQANITDLARMMVGADASWHGVVRTTLEARPASGGEPVLVVRNLVVLDDRRLKAVDGLSLEVRAGEIVGLAGVEGNGQRELADALAGLRRPSAGQVFIAGRDMSHASPGQMIDAGLSYIPEDRNSVGTIGRFNLAENGILKSQRRRPFARRGVLQLRPIAEHAAQMIENYDIRTPGADVEARTLSGGNRQKLILAREVARGSQVLIAMQPTRGLDLATTEFVQRELLALRDGGAAILLISTELDEVIALSDRIAVIYGGRIMGVVPREQATREGLGLLMAGMTHGGGAG